MFLTHLIGVYRQWRRYNQSVRELNQLGDRELSDIGISRGDIHARGLGSLRALLSARSTQFDSARPRRALSFWGRQAGSMPRGFQHRRGRGPGQQP